MQQQQNIEHLGTGEAGISWDRQAAWDRLEQRLQRPRKSLATRIRWPYPVAAVILALGVFLCLCPGDTSAPGLKLALQEQVRSGHLVVSSSSIRSSLHSVYSAPIKPVRKHGTPLARTGPAKHHAQQEAPGSGTSPENTADADTRSALLLIGRQPLCYSTPIPDRITPAYHIATSDL